MRYVLIALTLATSTVRVSCQENIHLSSVDQSLIQLLSFPPKGKGHLLMNTIKLYINTLQRILYLFKKRDKSVFSITEILWERNGPRFLLRRINDRKVKESFNWSLANLTEMYRLLNKAQNIWRELRQEYCYTIYGIH